MRHGRVGTFGVAAVGVVLLTACTSGAPGTGSSAAPDAAVTTAPAEVKPTEFILGTWDCAAYQNGEADPRASVMFTVTPDTVRVEPGTGGFFEAKINIVADVLYGESTGGGGGMPSTPGQKGTLSPFPTTLPADGEKLSLTFAPENGSPSTFGAYRDGPLVYLTKSDSSAGFGALECSRQG